MSTKPAPRPPREARGRGAPAGSRTLPPIHSSTGGARAAPRRASEARTLPRLPAGDGDYYCTAVVGEPRADLPEQAVYDKTLQRAVLPQGPGYSPLFGWLVGWLVGGGGGEGEGEKSQ